MAKTETSLGARTNEAQTSPSQQTKVSCQRPDLSTTALVVSTVGCNTRLLAGYLSMYGSSSLLFYIYIY